MTARYQRSLIWRRVLYAVLVSGGTLGGVGLMHHILRANGLSPGEAVILGLFAVTFALVVAAFWNAAIGFAVQLLAADAGTFVAPVAAAAGGDGPLSSRTALIMPVHNEDPQRVFAGLEATLRSLEATGRLEHFECFVLSDTTDTGIAAAERRLWRQACLRPGVQGRLHYRRRRHNRGRKVGNIADFCRRWGAAFDHMVVLDADSVMGGDTLVGLVRIMEAHPRVGIVQTVSLAVNQITPFARILQFGGRLCSELLATGQAFWQGDAGNYFGHNAIIRIRPFMAHCHLPLLPGRGPLSGEILSHDFVEAALMRRAGFQVWNLPQGRGSFEEMPSNIADYVKRDRRWCQGNLQHLRLLFAPGLHPVSRLHLLLGVLAYLSAPLWLLQMLLGVMGTVRLARGEWVYFLPGEPLFPHWPVSRTGEAIALFTVTLALLLAPRILGAVRVLSDRERRSGYGGGAALTLSLLVEMLFATLLAPVMMVFHTLFVVSILAGYTIIWDAQPRGSRGLESGEALWLHRWQLLLAVGLTLPVLALAPGHALWLAPVLAGLWLAVPLAVLSSRAALGRSLGRRGLMRIPEEIRPPKELAPLLPPGLPGEGPAVGEASRSRAA